MKKPFLRFIWNNFKDSKFVIGFISIFLGTIYWQVSPNYEIRLGIIVPVFGLLVAVIITFFEAACTGYYESYESQKGWPDVVQGMKQMGYPACLLEPSDLFPYGALVTFFYKPEETEEILGIGKVANIQDDKKIMVTLEHEGDGYEEEIEDIENNDGTILKDLIIRPTVPKRHMEMFLPYDTEEEYYEQ